MNHSAIEWLACRFNSIHIYKEFTTSFILLLFILLFLLLLLSWAIPCYSVTRMSQLTFYACNSFCKNVYFGVFFRLKLSLKQVENGSCDARIPKLKSLLWKSSTRRGATTRARFNDVPYDRLPTNVWLAPPPLAGGGCSLYLNKHYSYRSTKIT